MRWTVERLMLSAWASLMIVAAIWSRVQPLVDRAWSSVLLVAMQTTAARSEGGKAPGSAGAREVLQALQAVGDEAFAPLAHGVAAPGHPGPPPPAGGGVGPPRPRQDEGAGE